MLVAVAVVVAAAVIVTVIVVVVVVVTRGLLTASGPALTGRGRRHSTSGLAVMPATALVLTDLQHVVGYRQSQLGGKGRVIGGPVRQGDPGTGLWA